MIPESLLEADTWRYIAAASSAATCVAMVAALWIHGRALLERHRRWFYVLIAVIIQQAVNVYLTSSRAQATPPGFPEDRVDQPLVLLVLSGLGLLFAISAVVLGGNNSQESR